MRSLSQDPAPVGLLRKTAEEERASGGGGNDVSHVQRPEELVGGGGQAAVIPQQAAGGTVRRGIPIRGTEKRYERTTGGGAQLFARPIAASAGNDVEAVRVM